MRIWKVHSSSQQEPVVVPGSNYLNALRVARKAGMLFPAWAEEIVDPRSIPRVRIPATAAREAREAPQVIAVPYSGPEDLRTAEIYATESAARFLEEVEDPAFPATCKMAARKIREALALDNTMDPSP